jgi:uncharacterized repeat protein (TIGR03803 family)
MKLVATLRVAVARYLVSVLGCATAVALASPAAHAAQYQNLTNFSATTGTKGMTPTALLLDGGVLYGVTHQGGSASSQGLVFKLTPPTAGHTAWTRSVISVFQGGPDGSYPVAGLVEDGSGNLYGITQFGGANGQGTVFMMTPNPGHVLWRRRVIYSFVGATDAASPVGLAIDANGVLYGTASSGGNVAFSTANPGAVFMLKATNVVRTAWAETILHRFDTGTDGNQPHAGIAFGDHGKLYGTTYFGGAHSAGTVYQLTPNASAPTGYDETILYSFAGTFDGPGDGAYPSTALTISASGSIYGTTYYGGNNGQGTVFALTASSTGVRERIVYNFAGGLGGGSPATQLVLGAGNALYGTTYAGGAASFGTLFKLTVPASGLGTRTTLFSFGTPTATGASPNGNLILGPGATNSTATIYGTTSSGTASNNAGGTVYKFTTAGGPG